MERIILGAGITGLGAGLKTGYTIYEKTDKPGGICRSYKKKSFHFQNGGGHWIFGDSEFLNVLSFYSPLKTYERKAGVLINQMFDYPIQQSRDKYPIERHSIKAWNREQFGPGMANVFFDPFNERYTAGYHNYVVQDDAKKSPKTGSGYNHIFRYPANGLSDLVDKIASRCDIVYSKAAKSIDIQNRTITFSDGEKFGYKYIFSTLPLDVMLYMCDIYHSRLPFTSVLVLNIGAKKGRDLPDYHWVYTPYSKSGFYRVGIYSNIDKDFAAPGYAGLYVEIATANGRSINVERYASDVVNELQHMGWIGMADVVDSFWIDCAYTWMFPGTNRKDLIKTLRDHGIYQIGRYGKWRFQGILESFEDGMSLESGLHLIA